MPATSLRDRLLAVLDHPVPDGPDRYRTAGQLLRVLAGLFVVLGALVAAVFAVVAMMVLFLSLFLGTILQAVMFAMFGPFAPVLEGFPWFVQLAVTFLAAAAASLGLGLLVMVGVNHAYLRWIRRSPSAPWWARGVGLLGVLAGAPSLAEALRGNLGGNVGVTFLIVDAGLVLAGAALVVLTLDPDVEAQFDRDGPDGDGGGPGGRLEVVERS